MRTLILFLLVVSVAFAQETRRTTTLPSPNPADDTKPNNPQVPTFMPSAAISIAWLFCD